MAILVLPDNGQQIEIDDTIAKSDELVKKALVTAYPAAANATINRTTNAEGVLVVSVVKQSGQKGSSAGQALAFIRAVEEEINPALLLTWELKALERRGQFDFNTGIALQSRVSTAASEGTKQMGKVREVVRLMSDTMLPQVSSQVPTGF